MRRLLLFAAAAAWLFAAGCTFPVSQHPLTDERTSVLDERLIGYWTYVPRDKEKGPPAPYIIGRMKDKPNVLEMTFVELDGDGLAKVTQVPIYAAKLGEERFLSLLMAEEGVEKPGYLIARYELDDDDTARLYLLAPDVIVTAIESDKLTGVVKRQKRQEGSNPNDPPAIQEVRITAEPKELAAFLKTQGKAVFALDEPMTFKRTKTD
jgi:hypothetical protein